MLVCPKFEETVRITGEIFFATFDEAGRLLDMFHKKNLVMDTGRIHYAALAAGEASPYNFMTGIFELGTAGNAPTQTSNRSDITAKVANSQKEFDPLYPRTNDPETNPGTVGSNILTYRASYGTGEANDALTIDRMFITNPTPGAAEPLLMYVDGLAVVKNNTKLATAWVNHRVSS